MHTSRRVLLAGAAALATPLPLRAQAAARVVVPFPPGGPTDFAARLVADAIAPALGRPIVVENRPGGAGNIAAQQVVNAAPDGNTMLFSGSGRSINAALMRDLPFDPQRDLAPVVLVSSSPNLLTAGSRFAGATRADLLAEARRRPGALNLGVGSLGTSQHMAAELLKVLGGVDITVVPYRGAAPAMNDLIGGTLDLLLDGITSSLPQVRSGRIRALGVTSPERSATAPEIPAIAETLPGFGRPRGSACSVPAPRRPSASPNSTAPPTPRSPPRRCGRASRPPAPRRWAARRTARARTWPRS